MIELETDHPIAAGKNENYRRIETNFITVIAAVMPWLMLTFWIRVFKELFRVRF